jgi:hypothetical protein
MGRYEPQQNGAEICGLVEFLRPPHGDVLALSKVRKKDPWFLKRLHKNLMISDFGFVTCIGNQAIN